MRMIINTGGIVRLMLAAVFLLVFFMKGDETIEKIDQECKIDDEDYDQASSFKEPRFVLACLFK